MILGEAKMGRMRSISQQDLVLLLNKARQSKRKRAILRLHEHHEPVQRMVNAMMPGTYVAPHKHENPDKVELFSILMGQLAVLRFSDQGRVEQVIVLDANGLTKIVDIAPRTYHTVIPLKASVVLEVIQGPYDAATHKQFAPWAPKEGNPKAGDYLLHLQSILDNWG